MIRTALAEIGIFLIPFAVYAAFLVATRSGVFTTAAWPSPIVVRLAIAAFLLVILGLLLLSHFSGASPGSTYVPAHIDNGRLVPGAEK